MKGQEDFIALGEYDIPLPSSGMLTATYVSFSPRRQDRFPKNGSESMRGVVNDEDIDATDELLCDPEAMASIRRGETDIAAGRAVAWRDIRRD